jgi:hypothetical protein
MAEYTDHGTGTVVFCKDCKHHLKTFSMWLGQIDARCLRTHRPTVNLVTGKISKVDYYSLDRCCRERTNDYDSNCGERGRFWSPRKETPEMTMLLLKRTGNEIN